MSGLLATEAPIASVLNFLLQIIILIILLVGIKFGKEKTQSSLKKHGRIMTIVVVLNAVAILLVMGPSLIAYFSFPLTIVHHSFGIIAEILGVIFVFKKFGNVRMWMRLTAIFWLIALTLGISVYLIYYVI